MAAQLHADQLRKGTDVPYLAHLLGVASIALEYGASEDEAIAALLHDAAEDQGGMVTVGSIRQRFGDKVADIVVECTDTFEERPPPWRQRKEGYLASIANETPSARLISRADKLQNATAILRDYRQHGDQLWDRFEGGRDGILWYYRSLADAFSDLEPSPLSDRLEEAVSELERAAGLERS
jgi:GTP pyrophosphokinase